MVTFDIQGDCVELFDDATHGWDTSPTKPTIIKAEGVDDDVDLIVSRNTRMVIVLPASSLEQLKLNDSFENVMYTLPVVLSSNTTADLENMYLEAKRCADSFTQLLGVGWSTHNTLTYARVHSAVNKSGTFAGIGKIFRMDFKVDLGNFFQDIAVART